MCHSLSELVPPRCCLRLSVCMTMYVCVCVYLTKKLFISSSDPVLPELERIQLGIRLRLTRAARTLNCVLFGFKEGQKEWQNECPCLFYLDNLYHLL